MKLSEQIKKSILTYPSLYKCKTFEESRLAVLNQIFLVIGNGYEWAETKNPMKGGYLTDSAKYYRNGEKDGQRKFDKNYGVEKFKKEFSNNYFNNKVFYVSMPQDANIVGSEFINKRYRNDVHIEIEGLKEYDRKNPLERAFNTMMLMECDGHGFSPYPICNYSAIMELYDKDLFIQPDWLQGAIDIAERCLQYFNNEEEYKKDHNYPGNGSQKHSESTFREYEKKGADELAKLRKLWNYKDGETVEEHTKKYWEKYRKEYIAFINKFLKKYKNE